MKAAFHSLTILSLGAAAVLASAQAKPYTPKAGSKERQAIMDAVRPIAERETRTKVKFKVSNLKVQRGWAFMYAYPLQMNGKPVDWRRTKYREPLDEGMFDGGLGFLLRQRNGRWRIVKYVVGPTDVAWADWDKQYGCPPGILR